MSCWHCTSRWPQDYSRGHSLHILFSQLQQPGDILTGPLDIGGAVRQQLLQARSAGNDAEDGIDSLGVERLDALADVTGQGDDFLPQALAVRATPYGVLPNLVWKSIPPSPVKTKSACSSFC